MTTMEHAPAIPSPPVEQSLARGPAVRLRDALAYWSRFAGRHYLHGDRHGRYGPPRTEARMRAIEERIEERNERASAARGIGAPVPVATLEAGDIDAPRFQHDYVRRNRPVLLRGFAADWEAVRTWSPRELVRRFGATVVPARRRGEALDEDALTYTELSIADLVADIEQGRPTFGGHLEDLFRQHPELRRELDVPSLSSYLCLPRLWRRGRLAHVSSLQMFLSGAGTRTGYHCAGGPNLFVMVHGAKSWTLVPPEHSICMRPIARRDMFYAASAVDTRLSDADLADAGFPLYRFATRLTADLRPGDALFVPQWWWHSVETTAPSIGVATRTINSFLQGNPLFSAMWITSSVFRRAMLTILRTGWGSDAATGAKVAFTPERER